MDWSEWEPFYVNITKRLGIDSTMDYAAMKILSEIIKQVDSAPLLHRLKDSINGNEVIVFGSGPSLERHASLVLNSQKYRDATIMAADGAVSILLDYDLECDLLLQIWMEILRTC